MKQTLKERIEGMREDETIFEMLRLISISSVVVAAYAVGYLLVSLLVKAPLDALKIALVLLVPLLLVSLVRALVKAPRPFEVYGIEPPKGRHSKGRSFPSRHAHCAFAVASVMLFYQPVFGALLFAVGLSAALARVFMGLHFPRDVITGALTGTVSSLLGMLIFFIL